MHRLALLSLTLLPCLGAEQSVLVVRVADFRQRAIPGLQLRAEGGPPSAPSDDGGVARLALDPKVKPGQWIGLLLFKPKPDLVFIWPWDAHVIVPAFDNASEVPVVLANRGDRALLENSLAVKSMAARVLKKTPPQAKSERPVSDDQRRQEALAEVSRTYGLKPEDVDNAIRAWGAKTEDPYEKGLAALYEKHYPEATLQLQKSLSLRKGEVADAAFHLGQSLYAQGKYRDSVEAYQDSQKVRPDDPIVLNNLALSLAKAGDYGGAERLYNRALAIYEETLGPDHLNTASLLNNLASLLRDKGDYAGAKPLYCRALAIREKALGPNHPDVASSLNNLASALKGNGDYAGAERLWRRALKIEENTLGPDDPDTARSLNNLALSLQEQDNYLEAEPLLIRAAAILEKVRGPDHPDTAQLINNLAGLQQQKRDYAEAERLYRRALAIEEKTQGPDHSDTANVLNNFGLFLQQREDYAGAERLLSRALAIREKTLGPDHPSTATSLKNLALLLQLKGDSAGAEPLYRRALAIYEKALGPDHPYTQMVHKNLADLIQKKAQ